MPRYLRGGAFALGARGRTDNAVAPYRAHSNGTRASLADTCISGLELGSPTELMLYVSLLRR